MTIYTPESILNPEFKLIEESINHAIKMHEKYQTPIYVVFIGESVFFEKTKPETGTCSRYIEVGDDINIVNVNLSNGIETKTPFIHLTEERAMTFHYIQVDDNGCVYKVAYNTKIVNGEKYFSFDGGRTWHKQRQRAFDLAKASKHRMIVIPNKGSWPESSPEARKYFKYLKSSLIQINEEDYSEEISLDDLEEFSKLGGGYGFFGHALRDAKNYKDPKHKKEKDSIDRAFVAAANHLKLPKWIVAAYGDSKQGRKDADALAAKILDLDKTVDDFYLKDPEDVFETSYDFFVRSMRKYKSKLSKNKREKLKNFWTAALEKK